MSTDRSVPFPGSAPAPSSAAADASEAVRRSLAQTMADRASAFLLSLDEVQRSVAVRPFGDTEERERWFYTPTDHGGLALSSMTAMQQRLVFHLLASSLSKGAYVTATTIIGLDNVLDEVEGFGTDWGRERGRDPGLYYLRVFGVPGPVGWWSWRFGGHHVSLHMTICDGLLVSTTPCFLGADPASSPLLGTAPLRPLAGAEDSARELLHSLSPSQLEVALVSPIPPVDLVGANRARLMEGDSALPLADVWRGRFEGDLAARVDAAQRGMEKAVGTLPEHLRALSYSKVPKGLSVAEFTRQQRQSLRRVLDMYLGRMPDAFAEVESVKYEGGRLDELSFLWAGSREPSAPHYYRIQGQRLFVEYDNAARNANHVHTVWRDTDNDFGSDVLRHYVSPG